MPPDSGDSGDSGNDAHDPLLGLVLASRYRLDVRLGNGATGAVYRASHIKFGRQFAVKVLDAEGASDPKTVRRFDREAELGGKVKHPNVVSVIDVGVTDGIRFMVMELAIGIDLATVFQDEAPLTASRSLHLLRGLCEGLNHAHELGVIHRDFKPENIIIERDDHGGEVPRIVDFGIAIATAEAETPESQDRLTTTGLVLGTPHYMAPEQATASAMDHRIDLFALGVVAYEMLSGVMPYDGTGAEVARANMVQPTPAMSKRAPGVAVDPLLEAFTQRLMAKEPDARPPTANAARELLDLIEQDRAAAAALLGLPVEAAEAPPVPVGQSRRAETVPDPVLLARRAGKPPPSWLTPPGQASQTKPPPPAEAVVAPAPAPAAAPGPAAAPAPPLVRPPQETEQIAAASSGGRTRLVIAGVVALVVLIGAIYIGTRPGTREVAQSKYDAGNVVVTMLTPDAAAPIAAPADAEAAAEPDAAVFIIMPTPTPAPDAGTAARPPQPHTDAGAAPAPAADAAAPAAAPADAAAPVPSAAEIAAQYSAVGRDIKALSDRAGASAADDLWTRYRLIRLQDALASEAARARAATTLAALRRDLSARH